MRRTKKIIIFLLSLLFLTRCSLSLEVNLIQPSDSEILTNNTITFSCNVTSSNPIKLAALYTNSSGKFQLTRTYYVAGLNPDDSTILLYHFNNDSWVGENSTFLYDWSGVENHGNVVGVTYEPKGKFLGSYRFNCSDASYISVPESNSMDLVEEGTIEVWVKVEPFSGEAYIVTKGNTDVMFSPYTLSLQKYLDKARVWLYLANGTDVASYGPTNPFELGKWYLIVATWNSTHVRIYINDTLQYEGSITILPFKNDEDLRIGGNSYLQTFFNGSMDELVIYNRSLSEEEIKQHYNLALTPKVLANWTIHLSDGLYAWNCLGFDNTTSKFAPSNYTLIVDVYTGPSIRKILYKPSSLDDLDPDVAVNVTAEIEDLSGVSSAILQYKRSGVTTWNNVSMQKESPNLWKASFVPESPPDVWNFRIWTNDSWGHSTLSSVYNLSIDYDHTWKVIPKSLGDVYIPIETTDELTVLVINNTGDYPLNFKISSSWQATFYNISDYDNFDLNAKEFRAIRVNITTPDIPGEYSIQLKIDATTAEADPDYILVNGSIIAYASGPYLKVEIKSYPSNILQNQKTNLTVRIRNVGNETAINSSLEWILPAGWVNVTGNLNQFLGNLSSGEIVYHEIEVYLDPSEAMRGAVNLGVNVSCSQGVYAEDWKVVGVECNPADNICGAGCYYSVDDDCPRPSPKGIIVPKLIPKPLSLMVELPTRIDIYRGETKEFLVKILNPLEGKVVRNVSLTLSGYPLAHIFISPSILYELKFNSTAAFRVGISAPSYLKCKEYEIEVMIKGWVREGENLTLISQTFPLIIGVHSITENESIRVLREANKSLTLLEKHNITTTRLREIFEEALKALKDWNFDLALELGNRILEEKDKALKTLQLLQTLKRKIEEAEAYGIRVSETRKMYSLAFSAFEREDYSRAKDRLMTALMVYSSEARLLPLKKLLYRYWWLLFSSCSLATFLSVLLYRRSLISSIERKIKFLNKEEENLKNLMKELETLYFRKKKISKQEFESAMGEYRKRLRKIRAKKLELESKKIGILRIRKRKSYEEEKRKLESLLLKLQNDYFKLGRISKEEYLSSIEGVRKRLAEIDKRLKVEKT